MMSRDALKIRTITHRELASFRVRRRESDPFKGKAAAQVKGKNLVTWTLKLLSSLKVKYLSRSALLDNYINASNFTAEVFRTSLL